MRRATLLVLDESILDRVGVATPCAAEWSRMAGDERVRHCPDCRQNVYDLSTMSRREAVALLEAREKLPCIRLFRRSDGTLVTRDCREILRRARQRGVWTLAVALVLVGLAQLGLKVWGLQTLRDLWWADAAPAPREARPEPFLGAPAPPPPAPLPGTLGEPNRDDPDDGVFMGRAARPAPRQGKSRPQPPRLAPKAARQDLGMLGAATISDGDL